MSEKVSKKSNNGIKKKKEKLKSLFPEVFTEGKIDFEKLQNILGDEVSSEDETYSFTWAGKQEAIKNIKASSNGTLVPDKEESIDFDDSDNLFIEGDNLEVLKLLQKGYSNSIKMIYIDPPYNKGKDFVYKDDYKDNIENYLEQTGQVDNEGNKLSTNTETNGRFHSDWLTMMYPRLFLARNLLKKDGIIFISIDDDEIHNLRKICDEIFGEKNLEGTIKWRRRHNQPNDKSKMISKVSEYILVYSKDSNFLKSEETFYGVPLSEKRKKEYTNPDDDPRGPWTTNPWKAAKGRGGTRYKITTPTGKVYDEIWYGNKESYKKLLDDGKIYFPKDGNGLPRKKIYLKEAIKEGQPAIDFFTHQKYGSNQEASAELEKLFSDGGIFNNPKPTRLIKSMLNMSTTDDDIILDFFAGSATTAQAVLDMNEEDDGNRQFICVQLPEPTEKDSPAFNEGYKFISDIAKERIRRVIKGYGDKEPIDDGFKVFKLDKSNYKIWEEIEADEATVDDIEEQLKMFEDNLVNGHREIDVIYEIIIKEGYSLNANIKELDLEEVTIYEIKDENSSFYITLDDQINEDIVEKIDYDEETLFVCLDTALSDDAKINLSLRLNLKTI